MMQEHTRKQGSNTVFARQPLRKHRKGGSGSGNGITDAKKIQGTIKRKEIKTGWKNE